MIQTLFRSEMKTAPKVSIVLIDWSVRESYHVLEYLAGQSIPREDYEIIWIEYYSRRAEGIDQRLKKARAEGKAPPLDQWLILGIPENVLFHKHMMYNVGIAFSRGRLVTICDSDTMTGPHFVRTLAESFEESPNLVLHLDQVRNHNKKFYPFNYPTVEDAIGEGAVNYKDGKTTGLWDDQDPLHSRNYGGCLCAWRDDLIAIGGADEHLDYLGYVCGPYDMTFRLMNYGRRELWHPTELLYHVWHPGQSGDGSYVGPHDGKHMSSTALEALKSGRIKPLVENDAIKALREGKTLSLEEMSHKLMCRKRMKEWEHDFIFAHYKFRIWYTNEVLGAHKDHHIVKHGDRFFGVPMFLGSVDLNERSLIEHPDVVNANTAEEVNDMIDRRGPLVANKKAYTYPLLRKLLGLRVYEWLRSLAGKFDMEHKGFQILKHQGKSYGIPHMLESFDLKQNGLLQNPLVLIADTPAEIMRRIDNQGGCSVYKSHNLIRHDGRIYGIPHTLGPWDLRIKESREHPEVAVAGTPGETMRLIDQKS